MIVLLMGVSGSGKTAVGERLASRLGWTFFDGDDLHPVSNIEKMSAGTPLDDDDRQPWLVAIRELIDDHEKQGSSVIIACSALKESYRELLLAGTRTTRLVYLRGDRDLLEDRLRGRRGHFFDPGLLASQFQALEEPADAMVVEINNDLATVTETTMAELGLDEIVRSEE